MSIKSTLILILNFKSLFSQSKEKKLELNDSWFGWSGTENDKPLIVRGRESLHNLKNSGQYQERLELVWNIKSPTEKGLPEPDIGDFMGKVEDALIETLEKDLQTVLALVYTHDNIRSWIFYTKSSKVLMDRLNRALSEFEKLPISISNTTDKEWSMYEEFLEVYNPSE